MTVIRTEIKKVGQRYIDEPKLLSEKSLEASLTKAFYNEDRTIKEYERVKLNWLKPDGKGGLK
jgi:hypothetical protein